MPREPKPPDRVQGHERFRRHVDHRMVKAKQWVQIPLDTFMNDLVPAPANTPFKSNDYGCSIDLHHLRTKKGTPRLEKKCYPVLCDFISRAYKGGRLVVKDVADWPDKSLKDAQDLRRVDLCSYLVETKNDWKDPHLDVSKCDATRKTYAERNNFVHAISGIEAKLVNDGFVSTTNSKKFLRAGEVAAKTRGQILDYATEMQIRGHRTHVYMVYVYRTKVRILRCDRGAVVVSQEIDLETQSQKFFEFCYRLGRMNDEQFGLHPSAKIVSGELHKDPDWRRLEVAMLKLKNKIGEERRLYKAISASFGGNAWPVWRLQVLQQTPTGTITRRFLLRNLSTYSTTPTGRSTKGAIAFDPVLKKFVFVKDYWRPDTPRIRSELEVYAKIAAHPEIRGVATVLCGGDISSSSPEVPQRTVNDKYTPSQTRRVSLVHTRIVFNEVGVPLKEYTSSFELCVFLFHALQTHRLVWEVAGILHRDISDGNIIIYENPAKPKNKPMGLLIDWDLCQYKDDLDMGPRQKGRSGTWRFMLGTLLRYPLKGNELADDIESFVHVLSLFALRFHRHTKNSESIKSILKEHFDQATFNGGYWLGSDSKLEKMMDGALPFTLKTKDAFHHLLHSLLQVCKEHYAALDVDMLERHYGIPTVDTVVPTSHQSSREGPNLYINGADEDDLEEDDELDGSDDEETNDQDKQDEIEVEAEVHFSDNNDSYADADVVDHGTEKATDVVVEDLPSLAADSDVPAPVDHSPLPSSPEPSTPPPEPLPLGTHAAFYKAFEDALTQKEIAWTASDKVPDQFENIDWTSRPDATRRRSTKRNYDSAFDLSHLESQPDGEEEDEEEEDDDDEPPSKRLNTGSYSSRHSSGRSTQQSISSTLC